MSPLEKVFYEYGKALGRLEEFRRTCRTHYCVQRFTMRHFWRDARVVCDQKEIVNRHDGLIRDAWRKRAVCRRRCEQCGHFSPDEWGIGKHGCLKRYRITKKSSGVGCQFWEPRKEAGDEEE